MALGGAHAPGATPLDPDELAALIPTQITTQGELNEWEQRNIIQGQEWALGSRRLRFPSIATDTFVRDLHRKMFDQTWKWASAYRTSGKKIGIDWPQIPEQVRVACENARYWIENEEYEPVELSVRFHHRLVFVYPFPNGNGRHARLMADILLMKHFAADRLSWGGQNLGKAGESRNEYMAALAEADQGSFRRILAFARQSERIR